MEIRPEKPAPRTSKARTAKSVDPKPSIVSAQLQETPVAPKRKTLTKKTTPEIALKVPIRDDLDQMIATAAYFMAEQRQFAPGHEMQDWLAAEQLIRSSASSK